MSHTPKKKYGQNFLKDKNLLLKIVHSAGLNQQKVLEIGPGQGALTQFLVKEASEVIAFEIDTSLKPILNKLEQAHKNLKIVYQDFLETNLEPYQAYHMIGNIPYYITSPIIFRFLESNMPSATLMMQKEVGERLYASVNTKAYNALSVIIQMLTQVSKVMDVKKTMFYPVPKVDSVVVKLTRKKDVIEKEMLTFVKNAFMQKRKTLVNNLHQAYELEKGSIEKILASMDLLPQVRAEQITVDRFIALYQTFKLHL